ncbi:MAG TPA: FAD-dependent oxidoreductase [Candidatus Saccharimonadales bacterium]|nr:FAD-dependent oxidoreductase [Candidatus Saccharimonadales bacterium]
MEFHFQGKREEADAATFLFTPPDGFTWTAGQSIKVEVAGPYGPLEHRFSISSAPYEGIIAITTRLSGSAYKNSLAKLQPGDSVKGYGLEGTFTWRESTAPLIFIAAGIGITPFHAILKQRIHEGAPVPVMLLYGSTTPDAIFAQEFDAWQRERPELSVRYIIGRHITTFDLPDHNEHLIYISGPSLMVDELSAELIERGVPETRLIRDWFTGRLPQLG